jgi:hypothetical protein
MPVQVTAQVLHPGVQHQREGADAAQPARIGRELRQRGSGALHQLLVPPARVVGGQRVRLVRQREDPVRRASAVQPVRSGPSQVIRSAEASVLSGAGLPGGTSARRLFT